MLAVLLTLALFLVWSAFGLAALVALRADVRDLRVALTAPILGTALTVIPLFMLSNAGVRLDRGALPVWVVLLVGSIVVLGWRRPRLSLAVLPVFVLCLVELVLLGRPMFQFGFDWIANANADMGTYVLSATELMRHGLQSAVDLHALADNRGFPTSVQTLNLRGLRPGPQVALAGLAAVTGKSPVALYMPMSIAIAMCGVCATGALAMQASRRWWAASVAGALLIASPLAGYGVMQQLLPQDWGLGLGAALFAWLMRPALYRTKGARIPDLFVISVLAAALFVVAYEVASTLAVGYGLFAVFLLLRRRVSLPAVGLLWGLPLVATAVVTNTFLPRALGYIESYVLPFGTSVGFRGVSLFGYAVVPTALPGFAGLQSLFAGTTAPHIDLYILAAAGLLAAALIACVVTAFKGSAASVTLLGDLALGALLVKNGNDFGLFKLYMYMQPFLAATIAVLLSILRGRRTVLAVAVLIALVGAKQLSTLNGYVDDSMHPIDLRNASEADLLPKFRRLFAAATVPVVTVTDNFALEELEGASVGDKRLFFLSRNIYDSSWKSRKFSVPTLDGVKRIGFSENAATSRVLARGSCVVLLPTGSQLALNRRSLPEGSPNLIMRRCGGAKNVLMFVVSSVGQPATLPADRRAVSFWQLVADPSFPGRTFSGFGRYALFQILDSTPSLRVALDFTTSSLQTRNGSYRLPPAAVVGATRARFPVIGSGSARVISPPLRPTMIGGRPYLVLDMGTNGHFPRVGRPGVTGLWGKSALLDPRLLTSYVRDVSLVSPAQYSRLRAPLRIRTFPADLADLGLEYSGIFEDGWVGQTSYARLSGGPAGRLVIRALVVPRREGQRLRVLVNGRTVESRSVKAGLLDLSIPLPAASDRRTIELRWAGATRLSALDPRRAAAHLTFLGVAEPPLALRTFPAGLADPGLVHSGIFQDGWLRKDARVVLAGGVASRLSLRAHVATAGQQLELRVNGHTVASRAVKPGELEIQTSIPASASSRTVELRWTKTARIAPNDRRHAAALLQSIAIAAP